MKRMLRMSLLGLFAVSLLASCDKNGKDNDKDKGFTAKEPELKEDYVEEALGVNMEMVYVKGGIFNMGATSEQEEYAQDDEKPVRTVMLDGFHIGKFEVTQAQWTAVMGTTLEEKREGYAVRGEGDNYPMYYVTWDDANEFCKKLSEATGKRYVLPTEAQWEYAARGGVHNTKTLYAGSDDIEEVAWCFANSADESNNKSTHEVGTKKANALGVYDMSGNVQEMCSDYYDKYDEKAILINPQGPASGDMGRRVLRGGYFQDLTNDGFRVSARRRASPDQISVNYGFRVVVLP
ncbi:MAG: formylglycine-generating enzyme family protein [Bacteroidales bacterium]|nr:formylglycine-generating enzyme family protein [Bacteroidales bacterium]